MANLTEHARRELTLCGQYREDPAYAQSIVAAVAAFASYGHSGGSAEVARAQIAELLAWRNLSPLTTDPAEWIDRSEMTCTPPLWQNERRPDAFSKDGGLTYWLLDESGSNGTDGERRIHRSESHSGAAS